MNWLKNNNNKLLSAFMYAALLVSLYLMTRNFLLFHAYAEGFSIVIAVLMFVITWNARRYIDNQYLHFIGLGYLFIANIDFLHILGYTGMNVFPDYDFYANQLWVLGRYMESITLLTGFYFLHHQRKVNDYLVLSIYTAVSALGILSIFVWKIFPEAFIAGVGQTPFKLISAYIIMGILVLVLIGLKRYQSHFNPHLLRLISLSVGMTILSELFFTFYLDNYGISNVLGHYFKIISFYLIYKSIIEKGIQEPYDIIFRRLEQKRKLLAQANETKMKLFTIIGHDLRSPFNSLVGLMEMMSENPDVFEADEKKELYKEMHLSTKESYTLVSNLLDWASVNMENMKLNMTAVNPVATANTAAAGLRSMINAKSIELMITGDASLTIMADARSLETVMRNLLSNAIKYSHAGGTIKVRVLVHGDEVAIEVEDHGLGMTSQQIEKLMVSDINESTPGTAREKGTGLGFSIIKEFIELNNGRIEILSEAGQGTVIKVFFPHPPGM